MKSSREISKLIYIKLAYGNGSRMKYKELFKKDDLSQKWDFMDIYLIE